MLNESLMEIYISECENVGITPRYFTLSIQEKECTPFQT